MASSSTYGQKPLYYGTAKKSPIYYGSAQTPAYYGGGTPYYYGGQPQGQESDSLVGTITLGRVLRVIAQRWISVLVFLLIGLVASFAVYRISPTVYEARSEFTMDTRRHQSNGVVSGTDMEIYGNTYEEIFNTRLSDWRSEKIVMMIKTKFRQKHIDSTVTDQEILDSLVDSELELVRHSRNITIAVRSVKASLASELANAYAESIEEFTDEENKIRCDKAVKQHHEMVEKQRRTDEEINQRLLKFRREHKLDELTSSRDIVQQSIQKTTAEVLELRSKVTTAKEWEVVLKAAQDNPENFGALPTSVPRSAEIGQAYSAWQRVQMELTSLLASFTAQHPDVKAKQKELDAVKELFVAAVKRSLDTAKGDLATFKSQLASNENESERLRAQLADISQKIVQADAGLKQLEQEKEVSKTILTDLMQKEIEARNLADLQNETVRVGRPAKEPRKPVLPNPIIIFSAGAALALAFGLLFVLVLDHLEDTIVSLQDIEGRLALKVLAVLPHVRRKKREQVAKFISENKYSQFAEAVAGLRNLLDSPRYQPISQVVLLMSTQPGEGKTITSCSLAISSAQAGKRTLLVDFDLRRPRLARVWGLKIDQDHSFSHYLSRKDGGRDFSSLVMPSGVEHLDVIGSLPPDNVNPASIMGAQIVPDFFKWARANYDRIVIDSPPFGIVGDVMTLASMVDSVMIMCCPDRTHFKPIQHASRQLGESGATVIGIVVNDVEMGSLGAAFSPSGHSYGYGYGGYGGYRAYGGGYRPYAPIETAKHSYGDSREGEPIDPTKARNTANDAEDDESSDHHHGGAGQDIADEE